MMLGYLAETWAGLIGKEAGFTRYRVGYSCATRYHNIEKARRVLGYEPEVGLEEGVRRMVEVRFCCMRAGCHTDDRLRFSGSRRKMALRRCKRFIFDVCFRVMVWTYTPRSMYTRFARLMSRRILYRLH